MARAIERADLLFTTAISCGPSEAPVPQRRSGKAISGRSPGARFELHRDLWGLVRYRVGWMAIRRSPASAVSAILDTNRQSRMWFGGVESATADIGWSRRYGDCDETGKACSVQNGTIGTLAAGWWTWRTVQLLIAARKLMRLFKDGSITRTRRWKTPMRGTTQSTRRRRRPSTNSSTPLRPEEPTFGHPGEVRPG